MNQCARAVPRKRLGLRVNEGSDGGLDSSRNNACCETAFLDEPRIVEDVGVGVPEPLEDAQAQLVRVRGEQTALPRGGCSVEPLILTFRRAYRPAFSEDPARSESR